MGGPGSGRRKDEARRAEVARLRAEGLSPAAIGCRLRVSRQAVWDLVKAIERERELPRSFVCAGCATAIASAAARPCDSGAALCLPCLRRRERTTFAERLRACRLAVGLTRAALSRRAGVSWLTVERYELQGREPRRRQLTRLADVLGPDLMAEGA